MRELAAVPGAESLHIQYWKETAIVPGNPGTLIGRGSRWIRLDRLPDRLNMPADADVVHVSVEASSPSEQRPVLQQQIEKMLSQFVAAKGASVSISFDEMSFPSERLKIRCELRVTD